MRNRHFFIADLISLPLALYLSYVLRLETFALGQHRPGFLLLAALTLAIVPFIFWRVGIYARYWRYASVEELLLLAGSVTAGVLIAGTLSLAVAQLPFPKWPIPRSIPLISLLLALVGTAGPRFLVRMAARPLRIRWLHRLPTARSSQPVLIMGAGDAGAMIVRELQQNPHVGMEPVGFLDDDPAKHGSVIHGVPELG
ncbi:MAG: nucleoside-diphosphate sugar epimerase/dehydratase, partial [Anaerolineae bacterium]